jgi:hypothetical protein
MNVTSLIRAIWLDDRLGLHPSNVSHPCVIFLGGKIEALTASQLLIFVWWVFLMAMLYAWGHELVRATLHLEAEPISLCKRLEILTCDGPKGANRSQLFYHLEAGPIWWYDFFKLKNVCYDTAGTHWIGCTQNGGPILGLEANVIFH